MSDSINGVNSSITQTASQIRAEVSDSVNGLNSSITQNANRIALVVTQNSQGQDEVNTASVVAGINAQTGSFVAIQASKIDLTGYVTATDLEATNASITNLKAGNTTATALKATLLQANTTFNFQGSNAKWYKLTLLNSDNVPTTATFMIKA